jgi:hypothetical protein
MAERTSKKVASKASKVLSQSKSKTAKRVAASALEQAKGGNDKQEGCKSCFQSS